MMTPNAWKEVLEFGKMLEELEEERRLEELEEANRYHNPDACELDIMEWY